MKALLHRAIGRILPADATKLTPMRPEEIAASERFSERAQLDAMPAQWRFAGFTAQSHITAGRKLTPVRGGLCGSGKRGSCEPPAETPAPCSSYENARP